jgi:hypothetical protein
MGIEPEKVQKSYTEIDRRVNSKVKITKKLILLHYALNEFFSNILMQKKKKGQK